MRHRRRIATSWHDVVMPPPSPPDWTVQWEVSGWEQVFIEFKGSHAPIWLREPETGRLWLHKNCKLHRPRGVECLRDEDWTEAVSTQIAHAVGVPAAPVRMCLRNGARGSLSMDVRPEGYDLHNGVVVMEAVAGYIPHLEREPARDPGRPGVKRPGHTLKNIRAVLAAYDVPPGFSGPPELDAFDVFVGYLALDAIVANRDRHEQNWAVLTPDRASSAALLAPTYDHASSLGFNLTDSVRASNLRNLRRYAEGGTAHRFEHVGKNIPTLVDVAVEGLGLCTAAGRDHWVHQINELDLADIVVVIESKQIPEMSEVAATFARQLLELNIRRLQDDIKHFA